MCDIESYIYLPLLEEMNYVPTEKYAHAPEILAYARRIAEHYRLYDDSLLQTEVRSMPRLSLMVPFDLKRLHLA